MYLWNIKELKKVIVKRGLTEAELFSYILLYIGLSVIGMELVTYLPYDEADFNLWTYLQSAVNMFIPIFGTIMAYRANRGPKGKAFAAKYFSISLVVLIRFLIYLIPVMAVLITYYAMSFANDEEVQTGWFDVVLMSGWYAALYVSIVRHIRDTVRA